MNDDRPELKAETLIADLSRLKGAACTSCRAPLCGHTLLFSFAAGYKTTPRCAGCLAKAVGRPPEDLDADLRSYVHHRECYRSAWEWTSSAEGSCGIGGSAAPSLGGPPVPPPSRSKVPDVEWDAGDMGCGDLVLELRIRLQPLRPGQMLKVTARDPGAPEDMPAWCGLTGHTLVEARHPVYVIRKKEK